MIMRFMSKINNTDDNDNDEHHHHLLLLRFLFYLPCSSSFVKKIKQTCEHLLVADSLRKASPAANGHHANSIDWGPHSDA